ncbi:MAG: pentapeptide repeat-containing protein [Nitrospira sp.]|nr:pentapeptide repeat-containing protein [Nitrospira sp.]
MPLGHHWFIDVLRSGSPLEDKEVDPLPDLSLDIDHGKLPNPFKFVRCTFQASPKLPPELPRHGHPALVFDHCTFKKPLKFTGVEFHREVTFLTCRFERYVDFTNSKFFHGVNFEDCSFDEKVYFEKANFGIDREESDKGTPAHETNLKCDDCRPVLKGILESKFEYCHPMSCDSGEHNHDLKVCANFHAAVFNDGAEFDRARFHVPVCFHKTTWQKATTFLQCEFPFVKGSNSDADIINFSHAQISGSVEFNQSLRKSKKRSEKDEEEYKYGEVSEEFIHANFKYIHVHKPHGLRFHTENLTCCSVLGTNLDNCHFSNVRWPKVETHYPLALQKSSAFLRIFEQNSNNRRTRAWVVNKVVRICSGASHWIHSKASFIVRFATRWMVPHRSDDQGSNRSQTIAEYRESCRTLKQYCIWDHRLQNDEQDRALKDCNYETVEELEGEIPRWRDRWALLSRAYRDLKTAYEGNKDYIYASDFHYAEKEFRRINYEVPRQIRIQLQLYWLVSGYGERVLRPIWWFLLIWILGAIPYACSDQVTLKPDPPSQQNEQASGRLSSSIS